MKKRTHNIRKHKPVLRPRAKTVTGELSTTSKGAGFLDSIYLEPGNLNHALNGDFVEVEIINKPGRSRDEKAGRVIRVIKRAREVFVGSVIFDSKGAVLVPDDNKMYVKIRLEETNKENGNKVLVRFIDWKEGEDMPRGRILKVIGRKGEHNAEMESIVLESGFESGFSAEIEKEAKMAKDRFEESRSEEFARRKDLRDTLTFTIDPFDAKDFDDAISFRKVGENLYEIGVHIADVSHFVRTNSALDREALKRGCSVYLVDRTIPMLPEILSNDICSLNPHEDKLAFSASFMIDSNARIQSRWFGRTVINSDYRFTYESAQAVIDGDPKVVDKYSRGIQPISSAEQGMQFRDSLITLNKIAKKLQHKKFAAGAIEFEQEEVKFVLDEKGRPVSAHRYERMDTHKLVEEFMLLANREVAEFISKSTKKNGRNAASIYRIHDIPDKDKIKNLEAFAKALGYTLKTKDGAVTAKDLNDLLDQIENTPHEALIRTAAIRSMQKAIYSTKNTGHFGLAFQFYTHFTSPIRRYPDLLVHRILANHLHEAKFGDKDFSTFQNIAERCTNREIDAADAERSSRKLKQVEYMSERLGKQFKGVISGVTKWGLYIEEDETRSEGLVPVRNIGDDYFRYDEKKYSLIGEKTGKVFRLGDEVLFKVIAADLDRKQLEYSLV